MTGSQKLILFAMGIAVIAVFAIIGMLLFSPASKDTLPTLVAEVTLPPDPLLVAREPVCRQVVKVALVERALSGSASLDVDSATLQVDLQGVPVSAEGPPPAGEIWGTFEAVLAGWAEGCTGYVDLVITAGDYQARVSAADLLAWEAGQLDDGQLSSRVHLVYAEGGG